MRYKRSQLLAFPDNFQHKSRKHGAMQCYKSSTSNTPLPPSQINSTGVTAGEAGVLWAVFLLLLFLLFLFLFPLLIVIIFLFLMLFLVHVCPICRAILGGGFTWPVLIVLAVTAVSALPWWLVHEAILFWQGPRMKAEGCQLVMVQ